MFTKNKKKFILKLMKDVNLILFSQRGASPQRRTSDVMSSRRTSDVSNKSQPQSPSRQPLRNTKLLETCVVRICIVHELFTMRRKIKRITL